MSGRILVGDALRHTASETISPTPDDDMFGPHSVDICADIDEPLVVESGEHVVLPAYEEVSVPTDVAVQISGRSSHMRQGLFMPVGWLDAGFTSSDEEPLKLEFGNTSDGASVIMPDEPAARLTLFDLGQDTEGYEGRWQA